MYAVQHVQASHHAQPVQRGPPVQPGLQPAPGVYINVYANNPLIMQYQAGPPKEAPKKTFVRDIRDDDTKKYRLGKELGSGSYGDVFEAEKVSTRQKVACKVQHVDSDYRMWAIQRELNVWQTACKGSKFVAQVFDASFSHADGAIRIYTELLAGGDTLALIRSLDKADLLHPVIVLGLSLHLAQGLSEMQARNILHRDIKTDNSLLTMKITPQMNKALWELTKTGTVSERLYHPLVEFWDQFSTNDRLAVWTDFGVSRVETDMKERSTYSMVPDARWTPGTSAPELFFNNHQSLQADIYSFGVLMHTLCTAKPPPPPGQKFPRIHSVYSSKLQELVDWCMQFELEDRPAAGEIIVELSKLWTAKNNEVKAVFNAHKDFRDRVAWQQSFLRQEALQRRVAAEAMARDQAAAKERERALEAWNELQREQKRIEAQQQQSGNSRRGQFTKEDRAKHLSKTAKLDITKSRTQMPPSEEVQQIMAWQQALAEQRAYYNTKLQYLQVYGVVRKQNAAAATEHKKKSSPAPSSSTPGHRSGSINPPVGGTPSYYTQSPQATDMPGDNATPRAHRSSRQAQYTSDATPRPHVVQSEPRVSSRTRSSSVSASSRSYNPGHASANSVSSRGSAYPTPQAQPTPQSHGSTPTSASVYSTPQAQPTPNNYASSRTSASVYPTPQAQPTPRSHGSTPTSASVYPTPQAQSTPNNYASARTIPSSHSTPLDPQARQYYAYTLANTTPMQPSPLASDSRPRETEQERQERKARERLERQERKGRDGQETEQERHERKARERQERKERERREAEAQDSRGRRDEPQRSSRRSVSQMPSAYR